MLEIYFVFLWKISKKPVQTEREDDRIRDHTMRNNPYRDPIVRFVHPG